MSRIITIPVTELRPGDQFVADGFMHYEIVESPEPFTHPDMVGEGTSVFVKFADGGFGHRVWDKGAEISVKRPKQQVRIAAPGRTITAYIQREGSGGAFWATKTQENNDRGYTLEADGTARQEIYLDGERISSKKIGTWKLA